MGLDSFIIKVTQKEYDKIKKGEKEANEHPYDNREHIYNSYDEIAYFRKVYWLHDYITKRYGGLNESSSPLDTSCIDKLILTLNNIVNTFKEITDDDYGIKNRYISICDSEYNSFKYAQLTPKGIRKMRESCGDLEEYIDEYNFQLEDDESCELIEYINYVLSQLENVRKHMEYDEYTDGTTTDVKYLYLSSF